MYTSVHKFTQLHCSGNIQLVKNSAFILNIDMQKNYAKILSIHMIMVMQQLGNNDCLVKINNVSRKQGLLWKLG